MASLTGEAEGSASVARLVTTFRITSESDFIPGFFSVCFSEVPAGALRLTREGQRVILPTLSRTGSLAEVEARRTIPRIIWPFLCAGTFAPRFNRTGRAF